MIIKGTNKLEPCYTALQCNVSHVTSVDYPTCENHMQTSDCVWRFNSCSSAVWRYWLFSTNTQV